MIEQLTKTVTLWKAAPIALKIGAHILAATLCIYLITSVSNIHNLKIISSEVSFDSHEYTPISLPYKKNYIGDYWVRLKLDALEPNTTVRIYPDDEILALKVNDIKEDLSKYSAKQKRSYSSGFSLKLNLDKISENILLFKLKNRSNPSGFNFVSERSINMTQGFFLIVVLSLYAVFLSLSLPITREQLLIACASIIACVIYLSSTGERERIFDVYEGGGHKDYIEHVAKTWALPDPGGGWEYHQPPLYYGIAATARNLFVDNPEISDLWGRVLALWFWAVFLLASLAALRIGLSGSRSIVLIVSFLFSFWPAGIIHSVRIGNDNPLYMFCALAFFFVVRWWQSSRRSDIWWASFWIFLAVITKSNGLILSAVMFGLIFFRAFGHAILTRKITTFWQRAWFPGAISACFTLLGLTLNLGDNFYQYAIGESEDWLLSNVSTTINPGLQVENGVLNYIIFDLSTFLQSAFISTWDDQYGRQYFWNFVLRSSLTSEYFFEGTPMAAWGIINGIMLLVLISSMIFVLAKYLERTSSNFVKRVYRHLPWIFLLAASFVFLLAYRIKVPLSCNTDFRYIYMCLTALVFFAGISLKSKGAIGRFGVLLPAVSIPLASIVWLGMLV